MLYVGLDVHWSMSMICVLDENGKEQHTRRIQGTWNILIEELRKIKEPFKICFEASTGYGVIYDKLKEIAEQVTVAHPGQLRLIFKSKRKTDRIDAQKLAKLLFFKEVPSVYVPAQYIRGWRSLIEHRTNLVHERTRSKNGIRTCLKGNGIVAPKSLWTRAGMAWLEKLDMATPMETIRKDDLVQRVIMNEAMIKRTETELQKIADRHPGIPILMSIPGIGIRTAEAVLAYIDDPQRFSSVRNIGTYFGLIPCLDESAGRKRYGHISKEGPASVRRLLLEAAWSAVRYNPVAREKFLRIKNGNAKRTRIAVVAVAHYLVRVMLSMLKNNTMWDLKKAA